MKNSRVILTLLLLIVIIACSFSIIILNNEVNNKNLFDNPFGPPSESLGIKERLVLSFLLNRQKDDLLTPVSNTGDDINFIIEMGESINSISVRLKNQGLLRNSDAFKNYLVYRGFDTQIQTGNFILNPQMTSIEIAEVLQDSSPGQINFGVLAGWRSEEIAATLPKSGLEVSQEHFLEIVRKDKAEGYLLPGLYTFDRSTSAEILVQTLTNAFDSEITNELLSGFQNNGLSLHEAIILASIIEREAVVTDEMPMIASVFINRLLIGMKLDADPTVQFAIGYNPSLGNWWTNPLSLSQLEINSPYNTYLYPGLPPGPICNPSLEAIRAVAFPAQTPYYYFRAACDQTGRHLFAETFQEHTNNACP